MKNIFRFLGKNSPKKAAGFEIEDAVLTITDKEAARIEMRISHRGAKIATLICLLLLFAFVGRIFYLDIVQGKYYQNVSKNNRIRQIIIKAPRGKIYDKKGTLLVENIPSIDVTIMPTDIPRDGEAQKTLAKKLADILDINEAAIKIAFDNSGKPDARPQLVKTNISQEQSLIIQEKIKELPGVRLEKTAIRKYLDSSIFSHIIGYDGKITQEELKENTLYSLTDNVGKVGLEKNYENLLHGVHGAELTEVDSLGKVQKQLGIDSPEAGADLYLNIDAQLQKKVYDSLTKVLEENESKLAAAIAIDPRNGGVLTLVSLPSFDNNLFSSGISAEDYSRLITDTTMPLFNRAVSGEYPPGSTIKPVIAAAALEEKTISEDTVVGCNGAINVGSFVFRDWKTHGPTDVKKAIAESCDVFFYSLGGGWGSITGLGMDTMKKYENRFGYGIKSGIDTTGEVSGLIPDENWKEENIGEKWYIGNSYHASIGQGYVKATPLQVANSIAAIANGGTLFRPRLVSKIKKGTDELEKKPEIISENLASKETIRTVREGMRQTVESGTAQTLKDLPVKVAGKTGTAQFGTEDKTHAWFVSYAPYENPEIAMVVLVEGGGEGHSSALPVTKEVYEWYFGQNRE